MLLSLLNLTSRVKFPMNYSSFSEGIFLRSNMNNEKEKCEKWNFLKFLHRANMCSLKELQRLDIFVRQLFSLHNFCSYSIRMHKVNDIHQMQ